VNIDSENSFSDGTSKCFNIINHRSTRMHGSSICSRCLLNFTNGGTKEAKMFTFQEIQINIVWFCLANFDNYLN
jgi:hypothetical protein